jgi:hypothetical protein
MRRIGSSNSEKGEFAGVGTALAHSHAGGRAHLQAIDGPEFARPLSALWEGR